MFPLRDLLSGFLFGLGRKCEVTVWAGLTDSVIVLLAAFVVSVVVCICFCRFVFVVTILPQAKLCLQLQFRSTPEWCIIWAPTLVTRNGLAYELSIGLQWTYTRLFLLGLDLLGAKVQGLFTTWCNLGLRPVVLTRLTLSVTAFLSKLLSVYSIVTTALLSLLLVVLRSMHIFRLDGTELNLSVRMTSVLDIPVILLKCLTSLCTNRILLVRLVQPAFVRVYVRISGSLHP